MLFLAETNGTSWADVAYIFAGFAGIALIVWTASKL